ncbi:unnamed protein product [Adineta ricciae]|uniref:Uncharacterized protein n=1 Tax=Adineta ricciae TaxID=249248 RepID=A0A815RGH6_ADIRI|nr:unnamed protein product [Adineta ricciae]CAF1476788.1 unnamed protein product [Adineta ricciae]
MANNHWNSTMLMKNHHKSHLASAPVNYTSTSQPLFKSNIHMRNSSIYPGLDTSRHHHHHHHQVVRSNPSPMIRGPSRNNQHLAERAAHIRQQRRHSHATTGSMGNAMMIGVPLVANGLMWGLRPAPQGNFAGGFSNVFGQLGGTSGLGGVATGFGDIGSDIGDIGSDLGDMGSDIGDIAGDLFDIVSDMF